MNRDLGFSLNVEEGVDFLPFCCVNVLSRQGENGRIKLLLVVPPPWGIQALHPHPWKKRTITKSGIPQMWVARKLSQDSVLLWVLQLDIH